MARSPAVLLDAIHKSFGEHAAVDGLSLEVPRGSVYGFIGPNGSGKTTSLRILLHILLPDRGRVEVLGQTGTRASNDRIGYLPEERGLYRKMGVRRLLAYYGALKGMSAADARQEGERWLERLDLAAWKDHRVEALSKGMMQKLQFITTVLARPELVILDEPFSGLDPVNREVLRTAILGLREAGASVLFSTHDMSVAEEMCDRICMIHRGRAVLDGTLEEIRRRYGSDTVRLEVDGGRSLLEGEVDFAAVRDLGRMQEIRLNGHDPQELLRRLAAKTKVRHFELVHPSLHDIFIRIAAPEAETEGAADAGTGPA